MKAWISLIGAFLCMAISDHTQPSEFVHLNQLGFYTTGPKVAVVQGATNANAFFVVSEGGDTVFSGRLGQQRSSAYSTILTRIADFSSFRKKGRYYIDVSGAGRSPKFTIGDDILREAAIATLKGFYFQRSSMELKQEFADKWHRPSGHADTVVLIHPSAASANRQAGSIIS
ncbi:MAG TPA: cellulase N-terminal Ig-like domain-containing protein, partial [Cyclobacteriaceae bacterium]|nr:cellulase N-terminal Ig-like domain-containing protein [Cyclobacteriaceae bacterium]